MSARTVYRWVSCKKLHAPDLGAGAKRVRAEFPESDLRRTRLEAIAKRKEEKIEAGVGFEMKDAMDAIDDLDPGRLKPVSLRTEAAKF